ncbi:unnamed protein product [Macrosiphum euphorbiae]|uniref:Reverse transcriptase domain-containing protein n=1 Tax=Macrosiphum euphorbiae TaxID=13131 RepID=A0AAV0XQ52_9HEMI|nr:unnamed protein product [Macrosiphum euphorbiae]
MLFSSAREIRRKEVMERHQVLERIIETIKCIGKNSMSYRSHTNESSYTLENNNVSLGNFLEILCLISKFDDVLRLHLENVINKSKNRLESNSSITKGRGNLITFISKTTVTYIIQILKSLIQENIVADIKEAGIYSNNISIPSGVPQGGHISPLLFILYMNDVGLVFKHTQFSMFADDLKLFYNINSLDDGSKLQDDFDNFKAWCYNNGLQVNINKCNSISFFRTKSPLNIAYYSYNYLLPKVDSIEDLGVIFSSSLSFTAHIQSITIKASRSLGFIIRNTRDFNNIVSLKILYFSLVRSIPEYCSILWNPYQLVWINNRKSSK